MSTGLLETPVSAPIRGRSQQTSQAREEMIAVVSHDLKNPLSTIQLSAGFLLDELLPDDPAHRASRVQLRVIQHAAERMDRLVHDLLDVAAADAGWLPMTRSSVAVPDLIDDAFELLRPLATARGIALICDVASSLPAVSADRDRILQVFSNLAGNAFKHTPSGGRVEVTAVSRAMMVEFSVRDTGAGIAHEDLTHVFDGFWQGARRARGGIGLGLAIVKGIVEAHGGEVRAESAIGCGSRFTFTLPSAVR